MRQQIQSLLNKHRIRERKSARKYTTKHIAQKLAKHSALARLEGDVEIADELWAWAENLQEEADEITPEQYDLVSVDHFTAIYRSHYTETKTEDTNE